MTQVLTNFVYPETLSFFKNQYFFPTHVESPHAVSVLPTFEDSPIFEWFKPEIVYQRRQPTLPLPETDPPLETTYEPVSENSFEAVPA